MGSLRDSAVTTQRIAKRERPPLIPPHAEGDSLTNLLLNLPAEPRIGSLSACGEGGGWGLSRFAPCEQKELAACGVR